MILILFSMQNTLKSRYYNIGEKEQGKYLVQTRSQAKSSGITLPEEYGINKAINPNIRPEKQVRKLILSPGKKLYLKLNLGKVKVELV